MESMISNRERENKGREKKGFNDNDTIDRHHHYTHMWSYCILLHGKMKLCLLNDSIEKCGRKTWISQLSSPCTLAEGQQSLDAVKVLFSTGGIRSRHEGRHLVHLCWDIRILGVDVAPGISGRFGALAAGYTALVFLITISGFQAGLLQNRTSARHPSCAATRGG